MDETTAKGMPPEEFALRVLLALIRKENDLIVSDWQPKIAYYIRVLFPSLYFWIMSKRALKIEKENAEKKKIF